MNYRDRIVLITGGNSGIGRAFVDRFVEAGARVFTCGCNARTLGELRAAHPGIDAWRCDIACAREVDALRDHIANECGRLDMLVNNAGVMTQVNFRDDGVDDATIAHEIETNLTAPILLTRRFLPLLREGREPLILMVTSGYALLPARRAPVYSATKAGLRAFTRALRYQLDGCGIRVVETLPPFVDTPLTANMPGRKMSPAAVVDATLRAIERGRDEVFVGQVRYLPWLMRLAPGLATHLVANS